MKEDPSVIPERPTTPAAFVGTLVGDVVLDGDESEVPDTVDVVVVEPPESTIAAKLMSVELKQLVAFTASASLLSWTNVMSTHCRFKRRVSVETTAGCI
jgi:hypothetical protein